jgi:hypothetical protein
MVKRDLTGFLLTDGASGFLPGVLFGCLSIEIRTNLELGPRPGRHEATLRTAAPDDHLFQISLRSRHWPHHVAQSGDKVRGVMNSQLIWGKAALCDPRFPPTN